MTEQWTVEQYREHLKKKPHQPKKKPSQKAIAEMRIMLHLAGIEFVEEHQFSDGRKFRFDFAILEHKIGIEYEGIMVGKSRHTTVTGYSKDTEKYNLAAAEGWKVFRYTKLTYRRLIDDLKFLSVKRSS